MRARFASVASGAAALLLVSGTALAQDLTPPSTGATSPPPDPSVPLPPAGTATPPPPAASSEGEKLDKDEKKDSGRGLEWLYLTADAGFAYINMSSL